MGWGKEETSLGGTETGSGEGNRKGKLTRRAGVRVPSTSKRHIVFLMGRSSRRGYMPAASVILTGRWDQRLSE